MPRGYADVVLYTIVGQGHAWPGVVKPRLIADQGSMSIKATDALWEFFAAHPKP
jgi:polyhydroxybutyrate depolymerase